jgi:hypothetical protein
MSKKVRVTSCSSNHAQPRRRPSSRTPLPSSPKSRRSTSRARPSGPSRQHQAASLAANLPPENYNLGNTLPKSKISTKMATAVVPDGLLVRARRTEDPDALGSSNGFTDGSTPSSTAATMDADSEDKGDDGRRRPVPVWSLVLCVVVAVFTLFGVGRLCLPHYEDSMANGIVVGGAAEGIRLGAIGSRPGDLESNDEPGAPTTWTALAARYSWHISELEHVVWYSWITAASTALGVLPFLFVRQFKPAVLAASNCVAAGMMIAATICLIWEGLMHKITEHGFDDSDTAMNYWSVAGGFLGGCIFMLASKHYLDQHEHLKFIGFEGTSIMRIHYSHTLYNKH